ncbi:MAG: ATP-binding protein [Candidatus Thiodiazotropha sp.]
MQQFLARFRIHTKLYAGFAVLLLILFLASFVIRLFLFQVRDEIDRMLSFNHPVEQLSLQLDARLDDAVAALGMFASMHDDNSLKRYRDELSEANQLIAKLEQMKFINLEPRYMGMLEEIRHDVDTLRGYGNQLLLTVDDDINYPGMAYANHHLNPIAKEIQLLITQMRQREQNRHDATGHELLLLKSDLRYYWVSVMSSVRAYLIYRDKELLHDARVYLDGMTQTLRKIGSADYELELDEQVALQALNDAKTRYEEGWQELQSIHTGERWRTDTYLMQTNISPLYTRIEEQLDRFVGFQQSRMAEISAQLRQHGNRISDYTDLFLFLGIITGAVIAFAISRLISKPIHQIASAMDDIANGGADLSRRLDETGRDEVANLARSFNSFALQAQHRAEEEHALSDLLRQSLKQTDLNDYLEDALKSVIKTVTWLSLIPKGGIFILPNSQESELRLAATYNFSNSQMEACACVPLGECLCGQAVDSREIVFANHTEHQHPHQHSETLPHSHYIVPIRLGETPLGVLTLYLPAEYERSGNKEAFLYKVAEVLSMGISLRQTNTELLVAKQRAESVNEQLRGITANIPGIIFQCRSTPQGQCEYPYIGPGTGSLLGKPEDDPDNDIQQLFSDVHQRDKERLEQALRTSFEKLQPINVEYRINQPGGGNRWILCSAQPRQTQNGNRLWDGILLDITDRKNLEFQFLQAQKLESVGQLAAGIAHEINTPTQYVQDNTRFLKDSFEDYMKAIGTYRQLRNQLTDKLVPTAWLEVVDETSEELDFDYLNEEIPQALSQSLDGLNRITTIVSAMKEFSHPGTDTKEPVDINAVIENLATVTRNEWKYVADLELNLSDELPSPMGFRDKVGQVILNLIVNASHAISDKIDSGAFERGHIGISTRYQNEQVEIRVCDDGLGIPYDIQQKIFDPFFTTKDVGKGTGQGLSIAQSVIVEQHQGSLSVESTPGEGATFTIQLPMNEPVADGAAKHQTESPSPSTTEA